MLKLRFTNNKHNAVWLVEPKATIGRGAGCDLLLDEPGIQPLHAEIRANHEQLHLLLFSDAVPVLLNGKTVPQKKLVVLRPKDTIRIADTELQVIDPKQESQAVPTLPRQQETTGWALKANHAALANRIFPVKTKTLVGRSKECDLSLAAAHLSRRHAELTIRDGLMYVRDLGSSNGTYVNGQRVTEARVKRGDELRFDTLSFGVMGPADDLDKTTVRPVSPALQAATDSARKSTPRNSSAAARKPQVPTPDEAQTERRPPARSSVNSASAAPAPRPTPVETIPPTEKSAAVGAVTGLILLLVIAAGGYFLWQSGGL